MKIKKAVWENLKVGDKVIDDEGDFGYIVASGKTLIHSHKYLRVRIYYWGNYASIIENATTTYYQYDKLDFKIVND